MAKITRPNKPLADVNVLPQKDGSNEIVACFMPDPDIVCGGEGESRAIIALDASKSIKNMFGFGGAFGGNPNFVEMVARKLGGILCDITKNRKASMMYWALGPGGDQIKQVGEFDQAGCAAADISGQSLNWGTGTKLLPPLKYIIDTFAKGSDFTMGVIITDGIIEDEEDCMKYCMQVGKELAAGKRKELKLVLIGVGSDVDQDQLESFDDMFEDTDLEDDVDIWSHGIASHMKDEDDIIGVLFGELMSEDKEVASSGSILDASGNEIKSFSDGLPGKFRFILPKGETVFTVHTPNGEVTQDISEALGTA
jgi:hypothetical protein